MRHGIGEQGRQIVAGSPGQGLRGAERQDDRELALAHPRVLPILADKVIIAGICRRRSECVNRDRGIFDLQGTGALRMARARLAPFARHECTA
ncbi:hypothetical protein BRDID11004_33310 [Bradyrhizobium diazoefficiens]|uniref:Uncharacterized protein n=1 Tax=Bradyrhizobium diazoefficiens TaxID=1355477 RepID=A0A810A1X2_9BRAD|nr:hypothetical protein F07S3_55960 [Bradyrhizobium diazoefficiens]BCA13447.1 hypothetical protein BDHF08_52940 [Bradyrhizobium diazoefficiens]BCE57857.1 hypothetical protein XF5B_53690 [Bradyrhizobium diazoefficiens]BCE66533.1 hypothetical protein XF6B_53320 [Bradyrhizobium diazoefficiens]BCE74199.1 hypothetical protein XF8B_43100 [Bradyrhizobium diazoefficiens]